ncbi:MAG TPA: hypothetical protein VLN56_00555, partial [Gammaproteobacteria bacterium]|nr:hypothetical protein [Gammaproteobacteria bacterium]
GPDQFQTLIQIKKSIKIGGHPAEFSPHIQNLSQDYILSSVNGASMHHSSPRVALQGGILR